MAVLLSASVSGERLRYFMLNKEVEIFEARDKAQRPPENAILITGSSSIRRWHPSIKQDLAPLTVIPRGFGGSTMADLSVFAARLVLPYRPRAVVIYEGDNDIGKYGQSPTSVAIALNAIISTIHNHLPDTRIYIISVKPTLARWRHWGQVKALNQRFKDLAEQDKRVNYIDAASAFLKTDGQLRDDVFVSDGQHFNEHGTKIWAEVIRQALVALEIKYEK